MRDQLGAAESPRALSEAGPAPTQGLAHLSSATLTSSPNSDGPPPSSPPPLITTTSPRPELCKPLKA